MVACPVPPTICYVSCQPMPCFVVPCPAPPPAHHPPPQHHQPPQHQQPPCPLPPCCRPPSGGHHGGSGGGGGGGGGRHHSGGHRQGCICYPPVPAGLPSSHNGNVGHRNANGERSEKTDRCPTCGHGSAKEAVNKIERKERPSDYGTPGALSTPGAGCQGPPCLNRGVCPAPCQPQFPPMLPCCTTKCPPGPCPTPGTSLMVGMDPPPPKCKPCCGKPPGCSPASEFPFNNPGPCEPCLWPPLCLRG